MNYIFPPAAVATLPIRGSGAVFPVHRVYCIGRNYAAHAIEMGHDPNKEPPLFFQKNPDNLVAGKATFQYPSATKDVHHEIELVVLLGKGGENIPADKALDHILGYAVGLDMTRRDLQEEAKKMGRPWEVGKSFEGSAPCGEVVLASEIGHPDSGAIWLNVNGKKVQTGDLNQLIWKVPAAIARLSEFFRLAPGDAIMTGTPSGAGPLNRGDDLHGHIDGVGDLKVKVV